MNKFFKLVGITFALALLVGPSTIFAQDGYSSTLSGRIRIDTKNINQSQEKTDPETGDVSKDETKAYNQQPHASDTYLKYNGTYTSGETTVNGSIRFERGSDKRITLKATTTAGDWTANGMSEWDENYNGANNPVTATRDSWVKLSHSSGLYFQAGYDEYIDTYYKQAGHCFCDEFSNSLEPAPGVESDYTRHTGLQVGYNMADLGLNVNLTNQQSSKDAKAAGMVAVLGSGDLINNSNVLHVNYTNVDAMGLDLTFQNVTARSTRHGEPQEKTYSSVGLGVAISPMESLNVAFNLNNNEIKESKDMQNGKATDLYTAGGYDLTSLTGDYALGGNLGGVGLSIINLAAKKRSAAVVTGTGPNKVATITEGEVNASGMLTELQYHVVLAGASVKASYMTESLTDWDNTLAENKKGWTYTSDTFFLRVEYNF